MGGTEYSFSKTHVPKPGWIKTVIKKKIVRSSFFQLMSLEKKILRYSRARKELPVRDNIEA